MAARQRKTFSRLADQARAQSGQRLSRLHQIQIEIRHNAKHGKHLIQHLPVLRGHANKRFQVGSLLQRLHQRAKLDSFGPRAENDQNAGRDWAVR